MHHQYCWSPDMSSTSSSPSSFIFWGMGSELREDTALLDEPFADATRVQHQLWGAAWGGPPQHSAPVRLCLHDARTEAQGSRLRLFQWGQSGGQFHHANIAVFHEKGTSSHFQGLQVQKEHAQTGACWIWWKEGHRGGESCVTSAFSFVVFLGLEG